MKTYTTVILGLLLLAAGACTRDPAARAERAMATGDAYLSSGKFREANIEYRNAVRAQPDRAAAHYKLARTYAELNDPPNAFAEYARAADLDPSNVDAQLQAGSLLLMAGEFAKARMRAELALKAAPRDPRAHILLGNALAGLNDTARAMKQMQQAIALDPSYAPAYSALGSLQFGSGSHAEAGKSFQQAVELAPKSVDAWLALANYRWAVDDRPGAEKALHDALALDPANVLAHRGLALLYLAERRFQEAEAEFRTLASRSSDAALALADFYSGMHREDDALKVLQGIASDARAREQAQLRIAAIDQLQGRHAEAVAIADKLLNENPRNVDATVLRARLRLAGGDLEAARQDARNAVAADPSSAAAQYTLGLVALAGQDLVSAQSAFERVLALNPRAAAARMRLAQVHLAAGDATRAVASAEEAAAIRSSDPEAAVLLSRSLRATGDIDRARRRLWPFVQHDSENPSVQAELGWIELEGHNAAAARAAFERALRLSPRLEEARTGAVAADVAAHDMTGARRRVDLWLAQDPHDPAAEILAARLDLADTNAQSAEARLMDVIQHSPLRLDAYELLGALYLRQGRPDAALERYRALAARVPDAPGPATMVGMILQAKGDRSAARAQYEAVLARNPHAGVAANNLAWMLAEDGQLDEAMRLATIAAEEMHDRPEANDTLGWVYLQKKLPAQATASFQRAVELAPSNKLYADHLAAAKNAVAKTQRPVPKPQPIPSKKGQSAGNR